jgi:hypothetical protein
MATMHASDFAFVDGDKKGTQIESVGNSASSKSAIGSLLASDAKKGAAVHVRSQYTSC